ncbi:hypothetical protein CN689_27015 [Peribacillus butanolivorans]|uniref:Uncharacterized protein n=1 Tax=Peribacillus butanolivorans TaxID=421767 RepID=A0AAX0RY63_9BACI|nr:hypothetical protein CN689_27015 [Peribacillus butanolivorans]
MIKPIMKCQVIVGNLVVSITTEKFLIGKVQRTPAKPSQVPDIYTIQECEKRRVSVNYTQSGL